MGTSPLSPIQVYELNSENGTTYRISLRKEMDSSTPVKGFNQARGTEQEVIIYEDELRTDLLRFTNKVQGVDLVTVRSAVDILGALRPTIDKCTTRNI